MKASGGDSRNGRASGTTNGTTSGFGTANGLTHGTAHGTAHDPAHGTAHDPAHGTANHTMDAYARWADIRDDERQSDFQSYVGNIAEARYVIRRVLRIVDEQARQHGLEPLPHQALLQIYGAGPAGMAVNALARRLDVAGAFASRLVRQLEDLSLVRREHSAADKRVTQVTATAEGAERLRAIDDSVHHHVAYFQRQFDDQQRLAALSIFAFYVGLDPDSEVAGAIRRA
ncbi:MarR family winged helix-turn-helix transcriptional regulator [Streptomyces hoynatensis]|uniref:MarR family transcriptional regulator n=1 Tax=Streptomyces hoynatensis TaxID=1141874 RepID=A0A3A9YNQ7_9ACTN|nr:MarR family winged helix-turn-helix transcriptional regulator [Streptomyces hoynatensis]RKN37024.1 MarR family transcriptional regulator [Streptomyces hoynatensis]